MGIGVQLVILPLLILLFSVTFGVLVQGVVEVESISRQKLVEAERKLNLHKKLAVKSIQSEDGDVIDCIDIYKQPAFNQPALRNHTIQMKPSYIPTEEEGTRADSSSVAVTSQLWQRSGSCPKGTIPVRRARKEDLLKANSVKEYGRKKQRFSQQSKQLDDNPNLFLQVQNHSLAILLSYGFRYTGVKGDIGVWNPFVESDDEYSTCRVALTNGYYKSPESVESGWAVNPSVYGDRQTRLFVYWTANASNTTAGCFDLTCPGFVQTSSEIALGAAIYPISVPRGLPYLITLYIFQDPKTRNWWVQYGERTNIGYWPPDLFNLLKYNAATVQWGGEVYSSKIGNDHPHTKTAMGSGKFPDYVFQDSGYAKRMRIRDNSMILKFPEWVQTYSDEYDCYDVFYLGDYISDPEFYFGGPGRSYKCP